MHNEQEWRRLMLEHTLHQTRWLGIIGAAIFPKEKATSEVLEQISIEIEQAKNLDEKTTKALEI